MAIYIKQVELQKVEKGRLRDDMGEFRKMMEQKKVQYGPYYQRQVLDRLEWVSQNQPRRPIITGKELKHIFYSKIEICPKILVEHGNFAQKSKFPEKFEILDEHGNFVQKSNFCLKIEIALKNRKFGQKSKFRSKIQL